MVQQPVTDVTEGGRLHVRHLSTYLTEIANTVQTACTTTS